MRITTRSIQVIVGVLFIISGLVKANDPLGLAYKMQEFFEVWSSGLSRGTFFARSALVNSFDFLHGHALFLSVSMITLEIMAGIALLIGWQKKFILYLLLVLIVFFTFLTGFAYLSRNPDGSPKFTNCGCFGDCLPITPFTSFMKDLALLVMIVLLIAGQRYIQPVLSRVLRSIILCLSLVFCLALQGYVLRYLPVVDCLPFKKGNNIEEQTRPPKNGKPTIFASRLVYRNKSTGELKEMSQDEFNSSKIWEDSNWEWKETITKLLQKGDDPAITGFSLVPVGDSMATDTAAALLQNEGNILLYFANPEGEGSEMDQTFLTNPNVRKLPVYIITSEPDYFLAHPQLAYGLPVLKCDATVFKMAARAHPTIYLIRKGTILNKWSLATLKGKLDQHPFEQKTK